MYVFNIKNKERESPRCQSKTVAWLSDTTKLSCMWSLGAGSRMRLELMRVGIPLEVLGKLGGRVWCQPAPHEQPVCARHIPACAARARGCLRHPAAKQQQVRILRPGKVLDSKHVVTHDVSDVSC